MDVFAGFPSDFPNVFKQQQQKQQQKQQLRQWQRHGFQMGLNTNSKRAAELIALSVPVLPRSNTPLGVLWRLHFLWVFLLFFQSRFFYVFVDNLLMLFWCIFTLIFLLNSSRLFACFWGIFQTSLIALILENEHLVYTRRSFSLPHPPRFGSFFRWKSKLQIKGNQWENTVKNQLKYRWNSHGKIMPFLMNLGAKMEVKCSPKSRNFGDISGSPQERQNGSPRPPKWSQNGSRSEPRGAKMYPGGDPSTPQDVPETPQDAPETPQDASDTPRDAPEALRYGPRRPKTA